MNKNEKFEIIKCFNCGKEIDNNKAAVCEQCGNYYCDDCSVWEYVDGDMKKSKILCNYCRFNYVPEETVEEEIDYDYLPDSEYCDECYNYYDSFSSEYFVCGCCGGTYCKDCFNVHSCRLSEDVVEMRKHNARLFNAVVNGNIVLVKEIFYQRENVKCGKCLLYSIIEGSYKIAEFFIENGTVLNEYSINNLILELNSMSENERENIKKFLIEKEIVVYKEFSKKSINMENLKY